jgi:predicted AAA+ superfamily ATPase
MIKREISSAVKQSAKRFPIVAVLGPRQSGKTTLVKAIFPKYDYVNLEEIDNRLLAKEDPRGFLENYNEYTIIDEIQHVPQLFSYLQAHVDSSNKQGQYIITGSQNFLLMEKVSQSLAGRIAIHYLLPLSFSELLTAGIIYKRFYSYLFNGSYPRLYDKNLHPHDWYSSYFQTYVEKDIRSLKQISNLSVFEKFIKMCAGRVGQILNLSSLASDVGITHNTAKAWISLLETSFIIYLLKPHYKNFNKRLIRSPKLYFVDVGLPVWLLGIEKIEQLTSHYSLGGLFENWVISEYLKSRYNKAKLFNGYFWRDKSGYEIDLLLEKGENLVPIEIKAGKTINKDYFKNINYLYKLSGCKKDGVVIYGGETSQKRTNIKIYSWKQIGDLFK